MRLTEKIRFIIALTFLLIVQAFSQNIHAQEKPAIVGESYPSVCENCYEKCLTKEFFKKLEPVLFEQFGDVSGEDAFSRLDNFAAAIQNSSDTSIGYIVYYGGKINKQGEFKIRTEAVMDYLLKYRKFDPARFKLVNGGFREKFEFELWISGIDNISPHLSPTILAEDVKFQGKMKSLNWGLLW